MLRIPYLDLRRANAEVMDDLVTTAEAVLRGGWYILGEEVTSFENEFAAIVGAREAIGVGNGLEALKLALDGWGNLAGRDVIVPANTYIATWLAVTAAGATPRPVDVDEKTWNIDIRAAANALDDTVGAIIPVHLYGCLVDVDALRAAINNKEIKILEDAAQAQGAKMGNRSAGSLGDAAAFSFYPAKNFGALGDAGAVTTNDQDLAERVRLLRNYGSRKKYIHELLGGNSRLDELQASFLRVKLRVLDNWNQTRRQIASEYLEGLRGAPGIGLPPQPNAPEMTVWHVFNIVVKERDKFRQLLEDRGIGTLVFYPEPPHLSEAYRHLGYAPGDFPVSERLAATTVGLPIGPYLTDAERAAVIDAVWDVARKLD